MKIKQWLIPILLLLSACKDEGRINQVKSSVLDTDMSITLGNALDHREVCEQTSWSQYDDEKGRPTVEYRCTLSEPTYLPEFRSLRSRYQNNLNKNLRDYNNRLNDALKAQQEELQVVDKARHVFDALTKSGDMQRYQEMSRHFNVYLMDPSIRQLKEFFSGEGGEQFIAEKMNGDPGVRRMLNQIYTVFSEAGLDGRNDENQFCSPSKLLLAPVTSPAEVRQSLDDCQAKMSQQGESYEVVDKRRRTELIKASLNRVNVNVDGIQYQEIFRWSVIPNEDPVLYYHAFTLGVKNHPDMDVTYQGNSMYYHLDFQKAYKGNNFSDYTDLLWQLVAVMYNIKN